MSIEDFIYVLNFLTKSKSYEIGLLGGEPTLHPNFLDFLDILN
jgi:organic radical activating enzyme